ncbi:MAG TPA: TRAP transporter substrate-binding protein [Syntrophorhabdaceae bacterium]|nr:TRAP transporter substrate-binding protein [Syntrophorhabdaceae bacterium]
MRRTNLLIGLVIGMVFFMNCTVFAADVVKLKFANYFPPTHMNSVMMGKYCDELNKKLAGKAELTQYAGSTLLTADKMAAGVASGIADIGLSNCSYTRGRFPVMEIMELPLGFPSAWVAAHVANDFHNKFKPKDFDQYHVLMLSSSPINVIQTLKKPVKTLEDVKGLKIRGTGRLGDIVKALGATPIPVSTPELYDSLKRGVIEGALLPMETLKGFKTGEVQKYVTASWKIGSTYAFYVVMNKNKWNSLPADVQKTITDFSNEFTERWAVEWNNIDIEGMDYFIKQGGQVIPLTAAESAKWVKASQPVVEDFKKDLTSKGFKAAEIDSWLKYVDERIDYWEKQEKSRKIPTTRQD